MLKLPSVKTPDASRLSGDVDSRPLKGTQGTRRDQLFRHVALIAGIVILVAGLSAGVFARFNGLGERPLTVDEYYFTRSVSFILEHGVPAFPTGGYYVRGLVPQYITAFSVLLFGKAGFAYRFPAVLFSLASVVLLYVYSRGTLGKIGAAALALTLLASSWHIEFARFARMYSAFQCVTLLFFIAIDQAFFREKWHLRYLPHLIALIAILTHALGVLFVPFLFIPFLASRNSDRFLASGFFYKLGGVSVVTALLCLSFTMFDFRNYGVLNRFPEGYIALSEAVLRTPAFPFWSVSENPLVNLGLLVTLLIVASAGLLIWRYMGGAIRSAEVVLVLLVISAALHAFLISFACVVILVFRYQIYRYCIHTKRSYALLGVALLIGIGWIAYALGVLEWIDYVDGGGYGLVWSLRRTFFGWPDLYDPIYGPWRRELPLIGLLVAGALLYQIPSKLRNPLSKLFHEPAFVVLYMVICFGVLNSHLDRTRYAFFIYPIMLYVIALSISEITQSLSSHMHLKNKTGLFTVAALAYIGIFSLTSDFNPSHIMNVATEEVSFRMSEYEPFARTWYPRPDYKSPADFLNRAIETDGSTRAIVVTSHPVSYYLRPEHAIYYDRTGIIFRNISRERGTTDAWSNKRLLSTAEDVRDYTKAVSTVWIVWQLDQKSFQIEDVWNDNLMRVSREFLSRDGRVEVVKVSLKSKRNDVH